MAAFHPLLLWCYCGSIVVLLWCCHICWYLVVYYAALCIPAPAPVYFVVAAAGYGCLFAHIALICLYPTYTPYLYPSFTLSLYRGHSEASQGYLIYYPSFLLILFYIKKSFIKNPSNKECNERYTYRSLFSDNYKPTVYRILIKENCNERL